MNILEKIVKTKKKEIEQLTKTRPLNVLEREPLFRGKTISMKESLIKRIPYGIIAEFKRKSPSKGSIHENANLVEITSAYCSAGAAALSILTDFEFFGGSLKDLETARLLNPLPILRKDFIIDEYQVYEARAAGADTLLIIAEILTGSEIRKLSAVAKSLDMEIILELHNEKQLNKLCEGIDIVGVNNRNLEDFSVDVSTSLNLSKHIPGDFLKVAESGINSMAAIRQLIDSGYQGFLIGEYFMKQQDPGKACQEFIQHIKRI